MESNCYAYKIYWIKENVNDNDWKYENDKPLAPSDFEALIIVTDFNQIQGVFEREFPGYPVSGITNIDKMVMPVAFQ